MTWQMPAPPSPRRIGFISTRFAGTDGVTLEARKWADLLTAMGHSCFWMAGQTDCDPAVTQAAPLAFFGHPEVLEIQRDLFGTTRRSRAKTDAIHALKNRLKDELHAFIDRFGIEVLVPQNILAIPMHVPLGLAMTEVIAETGLPTIAHHHDFSWERDRFALTAIADLLRAAFPPPLHGIEHVVINSMAQKELARRCGLGSTIIPNVLDFDTPPPPPDAYAADVRATIGLAPEDLFILQPTRVVARKGIEHSIELVRQLRHPRARLVLSHPAGDEGSDYMHLLRERIADAGVEVRFISDHVGERRGTNAAGGKVYTLADLYPHADLVTYPSLYEGFGNAFLEAIYFRKPVIVNRYAVYARDIAPLGFKCIEMSQVLGSDTVQLVRQLLADPDRRAEWAETNFQLGRKHFSYAVAGRRLAARLAWLLGEGN